MESQKNTLLPLGFHDTIPPFAQHGLEVAYSLNSSFASYGYQFVSPPLVELAQHHSSDAPQHGETQFLLTDPISQKTLRIRNDITFQIGRIAGERFRDSARPLRLSYHGPVLRIQGRGLHAERQLAQSGVELIGVDSVQADLEVLKLATQSLLDQGIKHLSIDFTIPNLSSALLEHHDISDGDAENILELLSKKNESALQAHKTEVCDQLLRILRLGSTADILPQLLAEFDLPTSSKQAISRLQEIIEHLHTSFEAITITVDPLERRGFDYHTSLGFSFFDTATEQELGRGGRYITAYEEPATGFSFNLNTLLHSIKPAKPLPAILVPFETPKATQDQVRARGYTIQLNVQEGELKTIASSLGLRFFLQDGKISPILE